MNNKYYTVRAREGKFYAKFSTMSEAQLVANREGGTVLEHDGLRLSQNGAKWEARLADYYLGRDYNPE